MLIMDIGLMVMDRIKCGLKGRDKLVLLDYWI